MKHNHSLIVSNEMILNYAFAVAEGKRTIKIQDVRRILIDAVKPNHPRTAYDRTHGLISGNRISAVLLRHPDMFVPERTPNGKSIKRYVVADSMGAVVL